MKNMGHSVTKTELLYNLLMDLNKIKIWLCEMKSLNIQIQIFLVIPGAWLSRTPTLSGTLDTSLRPGGAAPGFEPRPSCLRVRSVTITLRGRLSIF